VVVEEVSLLSGAVQFVAEKWSFARYWQGLKDLPEKQP